MPYKVSIDTAACIGCGACTSCDNFELGDVKGEPKAKVKKATVDKPGCSQEAADNCPVSCISVKKA